MREEDIEINVIVRVGPKNATAILDKGLKQRAGETSCEEEGLQRARPVLVHEVVEETDYSNWAGRVVANCVVGASDSNLDGNARARREKANKRGSGNWEGKFKVLGHARLSRGLNQVRQYGTAEIPLELATFDSNKTAEIPL